MRRAVARWRRERRARRSRLRPAPGRGALARALARSWRLVPARLLTAWLWFVEPLAGDLGPLGERLAAARLRRAGARVLASNLARRELELDLVLSQDGYLVAVEVKTSRCRADLALGARRFRPADRVGHGRARRLAAAADALGRSARRPARAEVVEVWIRGPRRRVELARHPLEGGAPAGRSRGAVRPP